MTVTAPRPDLLSEARRRASLRLPPDVSSEAIVLEAMRCIDSLRQEDREGVRAGLAMLAAPAPPPLLPPGASMLNWIMAAGTLSQGDGEPGVVTIRLPDQEWPPGMVARRA